MPDIATIRECEFYDFVNCADPEDLEQQRQTIESELAKKPDEHTMMLDRMRDRLAILNQAIAVC